MSKVRGKKLDQYCDWHNHDRLDGKDLVDGEWLTICWPDGSRTTQPITIKKYKIEGSDMGNRYDHPQQEAFVTINHNGLGVPVSLREHQDRLRLSRAQPAPEHATHSPSDTR